MGASSQAPQCAKGAMGGGGSRNRHWRMDLEYFGRGLLGPWPQADIGIVLWSLSVSADDWQTSDKLTRMCTIPEPATLTGTWDKSASALEAKILRPLLWFGLLETAAKRSRTPGSGRGITTARPRYSSGCSSLMSKWSFQRGLVTDGPFYSAVWALLPGAPRSGRRFDRIGQPHSGAFGASIDPGLNDRAELLLAPRRWLAPGAGTPTPRYQFVLGHMLV
jgi:hypothetical protein